MNGNLSIATSRFGTLSLRGDEIICFPRGLVGLEDCRRWVFIADAEQDLVAWLQSVDCPELAIAVACPQRLVPGYKVRVTKQELESLELADLQEAEVLVILGRGERGLTANLRAPLVLHPSRHLGKQIIANSDLPLQFVLQEPERVLRRSA